VTDVPPEPPTPIDYRTPERSGPLAVTFDWSTFARATLLVCLTIVILLFVVPRFERTFEAAAVTLPATTKALFALHGSLLDGWWLALLTIPPGLAFLVGQFGPTGRRLARAAIVLAFSGLVLFVTIAVIQPMIALMERMSGAK
jgi:hypothetical protein